MHLSQQDKARALSFGIAISLLVCFCLYLGYFLQNNFSYNGEAFLKGYGHILEENFRKGLVVVICSSLVPATLFTYLFFLLLNRQVQVIAYKFLRAAALLLLALLLLYLGEKVRNGLRYTLTGNERLIEITITWGLRSIGFFLGYWLTKKHTLKYKNSEVTI